MAGHGGGVEGLVSIHATLAGGDPANAQDNELTVKFLSTPPSRVATSRKTRSLSVISFLSTPPSRVATLLSGLASSALLVSIHATLAGGDTTHWRAAAARDDVSIHATLAGGDRKHPAVFPEQLAFLSTPPSRVATGRLLRVLQSGSLFLSTPPSRVATPACRTQGRYRQRFYPRHPRGWRPGAAVALLFGKGVSIHATLAGGDVPRWYIQTAVCVSIHATLAGGDIFSGVFLVLLAEFLSTPPSRVAT